MNKLTFNLENCYEIKKLQAEFDFATHRVCTIYAPSGAKKTSPAQLVKYMTDSGASKDGIFQ